MISVRDEYKKLGTRQVLTLWSGAFCSDYEGKAVELPKHNGFMLNINGKKTRVECESPRTENNYLKVDEAFNQALTPA